MAHLHDGVKKLKNRVNRISDLMNHYNTNTERFSLQIGDCMKTVLNNRTKCIVTEMQTVNNAIKADFERLWVSVEQKIVLAEQGIGLIDEYLYHIEQEITKRSRVKSVSSSDTDEVSEDSPQQKHRLEDKRKWIQCENVQCPHEWFRYDWVELRRTPVKECTWYCLDCRKLVCFCNDVVAGSIVRCSNVECLIQLFHFSCVGLETRPKLPWYCENCQNGCLCEKVIQGGAEMKKCSNANCPIKSWHLDCTKLSGNLKRNWMCPKCKPCSVCYNVVTIGDFSVCDICTNEWCHDTCANGNDLQSQTSWRCVKCMNSCERI